MTILRTSTPSASYDSRFWRNNLLSAPSCRRIIETKSGQNRMFDPGGFEGRLRACQFLGTWRALLYGEVIFLERLVAICSVFGGSTTRDSKTFRSGAGELFTPYVWRSIAFPPQLGWLSLNMPCRAMGAGRATRGDRKSRTNGCRGASWSEELDGKELRECLVASVIWSREDFRFLDIVYHPSSPTTVRYADMKV